MADDYDIHKNKRRHKTYVSKSLVNKPLTGGPERKFRIASKVFDSSETHAFATEHGDLLIRVTEGGRQEVVAKFYEDTRGVFVLTFQRFTTETGVPHKTHFSFVGNEIDKFLDFVSNLRLVQFPSAERVNVTDLELKRMLLSPSQVRNLIESYRVSRRAYSLRGYAHGTTESVFPGGPRAGRPAISRACGGASVPLGRDGVHRQQAGLHHGDPAELGAAGGA